MLNEENIDFILTNSLFSEIQRKRIKKELHQISTFHDPSIKLAIVTLQSGLIIKVVFIEKYFFYWKKRSKF